MSPNLKTAALFQLSSVALFWAPVAGSVVALAAIATHVLFVRRTRAEVFTVALFGLGGGVCETGLMRAGLVHFTTQGTFAAVCPLWIVVFWAALGTLVGGPLSLLRERRWLAVAAGLAGAPLSFLGSERLGVLTLTRPLPLTLIIIAVAMGVAIAALFEASRRIASSPRPAAQ